MMLDTFKYASPYFVRWRTVGGNAKSFPILIGWDVIDRRGYKTMATFKANEEEQAKAICKLLNSNEEVSDGVSK